LVAPSFVSIPACIEAARGSVIEVGAQNVCEQGKGAFTGEVSVSMLKECGASFAIVGHSERRALYGESDALCVERAAFALANDLEVLFCIGETLAEREANATASVLERQLAPLLARVSSGLSTTHLIVAYEPVWAIGTGKVASPEMIAATHKDIRSLLVGVSDGDAVPVLYGGSVTADNFAEICAIETVDGALVGGASLSVEKFWPLVEIAAR
jgi:triosephosphate isomerase